MSGEDGGGDGDGGDSYHQDLEPENLIDVRLSVHALTPSQAAKVTANFANVIVGFAADDLVASMIVTPSASEVTDYCDIHREEP